MYEDVKVKWQGLYFYQTTKQQFIVEKCIVTENLKIAKKNNEIRKQEKLKKKN